MGHIQRGNRKGFLFFYIFILFLVSSYSLMADGRRNFIAPADTIGNGFSWKSEARVCLFNATEANSYLATVEAKADYQLIYLN